jgi:hypothetical protein
MLRRRHVFNLVIPYLHLMPDSRCHHCVDQRCTLPAAIAVLGQSPSAGACTLCEHYDGPCRGLGDRVAAVAAVTGIAAVARTVERVTGRPCGCAARRAALNAAVPQKGT